MLFTESQLMTSSNPLAILDEATYLNEDESIRRAQTIPIRENSNLDCNIVDFQDVVGLCEDYGVGFEQAIDILAEANSIPSCLIAVAVPEDILIESPELADDIPQVVIAPLSQSDPIGLFVEAAVQESLEQENEQILEDAMGMLLTEGIVGKVANALIAGGAGAIGAGKLKQYNVMKDIEKAGGSKGTTVGQFMVPDRFDRNGQALDLSMGGSIALSIGGSLKAIDKLGDKIPQWYQAYKDKPKTIIAKAIAKLRGLYAKLKAQSNKQVESGNAGIYHKVMAKITNVIDKLLRAMQRAAN